MVLGYELSIPDGKTTLLITMLYWEENVNHLTVRNSSKAKLKLFLLGKDQPIRINTVKTLKMSKLFLSLAITTESK